MKQQEKEEDAGTQPQTGLADLPELKKSRKALCVRLFVLIVKCPDCSGQIRVHFLGCAGQLA